MYIRNKLSTKRTKEKINIYILYTYIIQKHLFVLIILLNSLLCFLCRLRNLTEDGVVLKYIKKKSKAN